MDSTKLCLSHNAGLQARLDDLKNKIHHDKLLERTKQNPIWLHFGSGNIFRAYIADIAQTLLLKHKMQEGIIACDTYDDEIIDKIYKENDGISLSAILHTDGNIETKLIASIAQSCNFNADKEDRATIVDYCKNPKLQIITFTVTEKAYTLKNKDGEYLQAIKDSLNKPLEEANHIIPAIVYLLHERYLSCKQGISLLALDNCFHNGDRLKAAVMEIAKAYEERHQVDADFISYLTSGKVAFPLSMIDKIVPRPSTQIRDYLKGEGVLGVDIIKTQKGSFAASFVNSEPIGYLAIEDNFPNGRPLLEEAGAIICPRETVMLCENMKIESCLNPLQTALAIYGKLLSYNLISDCMQDNLLKTLVERLGDEGIKVVEDPKVIDPKHFLNEALKERLPNPYIYDSPSRIATDTSEKIKVRCALTINKYRKLHLKTDSLIAVKLVIAGFIRYLAEIDDSGKSFELSADPQLDYLKSMGAKLNISDPTDPTSQQVIDELIHNQELIGTDLCVDGLDIQIKEMIQKMCMGPGSIKEVLSLYLGKAN